MGHGGRAFWLVAVLVLVGWVAGASAEDSTEKRLRALEQQLRKAQDEIQQLRGQVQQQKAIGQATQKQAEDAQETAKTATAQAAKGGEMPDWLKRTTLFGDIRVRHEGFYNIAHKHTDVVTARNRERFRARLGVKVAFSDELSGTIRLATGNIDDPISTNETLTGAFNRKHINLDWAFLTFAPGASFGIRPGALSIVAGKFPNPIFRVGEMVFDDDLSPEGVSETVSLLSKPIGALDQVRLHALQWTFAEVSNNQDGWMVGGQVNPVLHLGTTQIEAGIGQYWWLNSDLIAQSFATNSTIKGSNTNLLVTEVVAGKPVVTGYLSTFNQTNPTVAVTFPNAVGTMPVKAFADYVYNWDAATDEAHGWMAGLRLGQPKVKGDWSAYGFYEHIGQEAAISAFTYSDFGFGGTNVEGPVVGIEYQLLNPLTISARSHFTNYVIRPADTTNGTMTRIELDALLKF
jgi:hypothetical protein